MSLPGQAQYNGYYDIRVAPGKGNGAFALEDIRAGTKILLDDALFKLDLGGREPNMRDVQNAYAGLTPAQKNIYDALPFSPQQPPVPPLLARYLCNKFDDHKGRASCFIHASRFNHSYRPNTTISGNLQGQMECLIIQDVKKDEELTFCYAEGFLFMTTAQRQTQMHSLGISQCKCELCMAPEEERYISDCRRLLLQHLYVYANQRDFAVLSGGMDPLPEFFTPLAEQEKADEYSVGWADLLATELAQAEGIIGRPSLALQYPPLLRSIYISARQNGDTRLSPAVLATLKAVHARMFMLRWVLDSATVARNGSLKQNIEKMLAEVRLIISRGGRLS